MTVLFPIVGIDSLTLSTGLCVLIFHIKHSVLQKQPHITNILYIFHLWDISVTLKIPFFLLI